MESASIFDAGAYAVASLACAFYKRPWARLVSKPCQSDCRTDTTARLGLTPGRVARYSARGRTILQGTTPAIPAYFLPNVGRLSHLERAVEVTSAPSMSFGVARFLNRVGVHGGVGTFIGLMESSPFVGLNRFTTPIADVSFSQCPGWELSSQPLPRR
jgi:hypothetical protein